jgi:adenylate kinase family enzyme
MESTGQKGGPNKTFNPSINPSLALPKHFYKASHLRDGKAYSDEAWIITQLNILNEACRFSVCEAYSRIYKETFNQEPIDYKKDNKARFAANSFLLDFQENQVNEMKSAVFKPQPKSWEVIAHLGIYPEYIIERTEWHARYMTYALKANPLIILSLLDPDPEFISIAISLNPSIKKMLEDRRYRSSKNAIEWLTTLAPVNFKLIILGNSGSGKTTLAAQCSDAYKIPSLCLDTIYWTPKQQGVRRPPEIANTLLMEFIEKNDQWVIEGCQGELLEIVVRYATQMIFLNPGPDVCMENHKSRPWEPDNYLSFSIQKGFMIESLIGIAEYYERQDLCSLHFHQWLFDNFSGKKNII